MRLVCYCVTDSVEQDATEQKDLQCKEMEAVKVEVGADER